MADNSLCTCKPCVCFTCFEKNCNHCRECIRGEALIDKCVFTNGDTPLTTADESTDHVYD